MEARYATQTILQLQRLPLIAFLAPSIPLRQLAFQSATRPPQHLFGRTLIRTSTKRSFSISTLRAQGGKQQQPPRSNQPTETNENSSPLGRISSQIFSRPLSRSSRPNERSEISNGALSGLNSPFQRASSSRVPIERMLDPSPLRPFEQNQPAPLQQTRPPPVPSMRLGPTLGKSIDVSSQRGTDLNRGLRKLSITLSINRVKQDHMRQRFHERPGLKKKRLKTERWRKRFKGGFQAIITKVQRMRNQGW